MNGFHTILLPYKGSKEWNQRKDEYLKWICGFANAQGGMIFIGLDDNGEVTGEIDYKKLMDEIPNKVVSHLGLVVGIEVAFLKDIYTEEYLQNLELSDRQLQGVLYVKNMTG